ncbi:DNA replication/checkpoint protein [Hypoxylon sp. NC1633]|nr:DNA replication/checkpoint protein [Hypoxylon sp. NC1633]
MDESERQKYEAASKQLRADLKYFEAGWASRNAGAKPSRDDIKQNPDIARKYKRYNHVRDILAGKLPPPPPPKTKSKATVKDSSDSQKRKIDDNLAHTPSKRTKSVVTPSQSRLKFIDPDLFETPSTRKLFSPAMPTSIGPTPQRDGRVLGLFDLLEENDENTPSRSRHGEPSEDLKIQATPSKRKTDEMDIGDAIGLDKSPPSTIKRGRLFATPSKRRNSNTALGRTPTSVSKLHLSTPSFLRRAPLASVDENGNYISPAPLRLPRKPLGCSLSSAVASLRKLEEEALDEDLEALHDMENDESESKTIEPPKAKEAILEPDSQAQQLLGGFDDEGLYDSPPEEVLGRDSQPLRAYKKKGQKRTTRRVNMKPTKSKRPQQTPDEEPEHDAEEDVIPETQVDATKTGDDLLSNLEPDSEFDPSEEEGEKAKGKKLTGKTKKLDKKEGKIRKTARKVNELAHANFKRLKLRNNGAKGAAPGSRFRRRR